ncbi:ribosomal protein S6 kinase delta-1 isoform X2 [Festucalex cinctus]
MPTRVVFVLQCRNSICLDLSCAEDWTITSEYGGASSDSGDLNSLAADTTADSLDDGVASGRTSPKQPQGAARASFSGGGSPRLRDRRRAPSPAAEASRPGRASLFSKKGGGGGLDEKLKAADYLDRAGELIREAVRKEEQRDYQAAFAFYRNGVDLLLQGVQGESSPTRREAVKKKTAEYLMRAEQISSQHLGSSMGQSSTQTLVMGAQCCASTRRGSQHSLSDDLGAYRVLGVIDKVLLVMDKRTRESLVVKGLRKSSDCSRVKKSVAPRSVPHMVQLKKLVNADDTVFLLLQHAEGGKLWSHIGKYLRTSNPDESFDIPFIQKSHTAGVRSPRCAAPPPDADSGAPGGSAPAARSHSATHANKNSEASPRKSDPFARLRKKAAAHHPDSGAASEEEGTDSYLTLCNEYEQEKVAPDALEEDARSEQEVASGTTAASQSDGSPSSPVGCRDFFAGEGRDPGDDGAKHTPMEFFRIDSKDSASEVTCLDWAEQQQQQLTSEVKGHGAHFWGLDQSDKESNESVPVISFKEAAEDEGHRPDLLSNLPVVGGAAEQPQTLAPGPGLEVATSPQRSIKPDVLQLAEEEEEERQPSSFASSSALMSLWDDYSLTFGQTDDASRQNNDSRPDAASSLPDKAVRSHAMEKIQAEAREKWVDFGGESSSADAVESGREGVSRLFAELDELSLAASQARIPEAFVRCWAAEMVTALDCLHQEGIVCRDLNPNNILLDRQGHVQLTYFCSWSDVEESCDKEASANMYCAPEVGGIGEETAACDWWSLGAILFELLTSTSLLQCHPAGIGRHTALNVPEWLSEEARSLLEQLLQYNPSERLGAGVAGADDVKSHPFFAKVDWSK